MKFLGFDKILCLSVHPDDVEFGCLGSIIKYKDTTFDILTCSIGGPTDKSTHPDRINKECRAIHAQLSNANSFYVSLDQSIGDLDQNKWIFLLEETFKIHNKNYNAIMTTSMLDAHAEHQMISNLGPALTRRYPISLIEYQGASITPYWIPNLYIDIEEYYPKKLSLLSLFVSQHSKPYFQSDMLNSFHSDYNCQKRGLSVIEKFKIISMYKGMNDG